MQLLILWDIDHTLIENAGVSKEIYAAAFTALTGIPPIVGAPTEGRTDRLIMRSVFRTHDLREPDWPTVEAALARAGEEHFGALRRRGTVLPGVVDALKAAHTRADWASSVLTGNIAANALVKLSAFDLVPLLDLGIGAYGADAEQRADLVTVARRRVRHRHELPADVPAVIIGDTPRDVEAALSAGCAIIAVASGIHSPAELAAAGAPVVLPDLSDTGRLLALLENVPGRP